VTGASAANTAAGRNELLDTSGRPDAALLGERFRGWAQQRMSAGLVVRRAAFPAEGGSSYNLLVDVEYAGGARVPGELVVKLGTPQPQDRVFPDEDLFRQARFMDVVATVTRLPVPAVLYAEADPAWLGVPFLVMRRCAGRSWPSDPPYTFSGWALEATPGARARMQSGLVRVLAGIHSVSADRCDLREFERPDLGDGALPALVGAVRALYGWGRAGRQYPLLERALRWLDDELPRRDEPACVTWGDARAGNLLFTGDEVTAVLDWEGAALGYGEVDLAFVAMMHRYYQDRAEAHGLPGLPDSFLPGDLAAEYAEISGKAPAPLHWYLVLAAARAAAIQLRFLSRLYAAGRPVPADLDAALGVSPILRRLLDNGQL